MKLFVKPEPDYENRDALNKVRSICIKNWLERVYIGKTVINEEKQANICIENITHRGKCCSRRRINKMAECVVHVLNESSKKYRYRDYRIL